MSETNKYGSFVVIEIFGLLQFMYQAKKMWQTFSLEKEIFNYLIQKLGEPDIDLFCKTARYVCIMET